MATICCKLGSYEAKNILKCSEHDYSEKESAVLQRILNHDQSADESDILNGKHILRPLQIFEVKNGICIVFPYIEGVTLREFYKDKSWETKLYYLPQILRQVFQGLSYLHNIKIIHNDPRKNNIIIQSLPHSTKINVMLIDYDISKLLPLKEPTKQQDINQQLVLFAKDTRDFAISMYEVVTGVNFNANAYRVAYDKYINKKQTHSFIDSALVPNFPTLKNAKLAKILVAFLNYIDMFVTQTPDVWPTPAEYLTRTWPTTHLINVLL
ncbi:kinase-like domain-containing protein [Syncephalis fuscata]|nr:kinase-like domain-containing protein [Syncephalis fuscata]